MCSRLLCPVLFTLCLAAACAPPAAERAAPASMRASGEAAPAAVEEPAPIRPGVAPPAGPYAPGFDAVHYDIHLTLPAEGTFIQGQTTAHVRLEAPRRDTLPLDLTGLAVEAARVDGYTVPFRHAEGKLHIPVPPEAEPGDTLRVDVVYHGHPDDGLILQHNVHGQPTAFADNWPDRARFWFPSIDHPSDKASVAFTVRTDPETPWTVVANGEQAPSPEPGLWRWVHATPIPTYTMVIGAAPFVVGTVGEACPTAQVVEACPEVTWWAFPPDTTRARRLFQRADEMVTFYSDLIAPFPYPKLAHVQSSTRFGGMENVSAIFYPEEALAAGRDIEPTVAHETAHQWFGNAVTPGDWHHLWLSEGFATYFGALFFEHADGPARFRALMEADRQHYLRSGVTGRPLVDPSEEDLFNLLNQNTYQKGAWVLHMLRGLLGDSTFFAGIRQYYHQHRHGNAVTADFQRAMEEAAHRALDGFFEQWVFRPGYLRFRLAWTWAAASGEVEVTLEQTQPAAWPTFRMPLMLEFSTPRGAVRHTVQVDERRTVLRLPLPAAPADVRLDPEGWVLQETTYEN